MLGTSVPSNGIPSNTHNGSCVPLIEAVPRILIFTGAPGAPEVAIVERPATCPASAWSIFLMVPTFSSEIPTVLTEAVNLRRSMF